MLAAQPQLSAYVCSPLILPARRVWICLLRDPDTDAVRYVGKTFYPPDNHERLNGHVKHPTNEGMAKWIKSLGGRKPIIQEIEEVEPYYNWPSREKFWIRYYLDRGCDLLNVQAGGLGGEPNLRASTKWRQPKHPKGKASKPSKLVEPRIIAKRVCPCCNGLFQPHTLHHVFCTTECRLRMLHPPQVPHEVACAHCGKSFMPIDYSGRFTIAVKYCGECPPAKRHPREPKTFTCLFCGRVEQTNWNHQRYCGSQCKAAFQMALQASINRVAWPENYGGAV